MRSEVAPRPARGSAPWTVWAYGALQLPGFAISFAVYDIDLGSRVGSILLELAIVLGILKGARLAWILALLLQGIGVVGSAGLFSRIGKGVNTWVVLVWVSLVVLGLIALLHPRTRAWTRPG